MNMDSQVKQIIDYVSSHPVVWRFLLVKKSHTSIWEAKDLYKDSPFRVIKLYKVNNKDKNVIICTFISSNGEISIISNMELQNPKLLIKLCDIVQKSTKTSREVDSLNGTSNIDDIFEQELFTYYYLQKEQEKRQIYRKRKNLFLMTYVLFLFFSITLFVLFINDKEKVKDIVVLISCICTLGSLTSALLIQFRDIRKIRDSFFSSDVIRKAEHRLEEQNKANTCNK